MTRTTFSQINTAQQFYLFGYALMKSTKAEVNFLGQAVERVYALHSGGTYANRVHLAPDTVVYIGEGAEQSSFEDSTISNRMWLAGYR